MGGAAQCAAIERSAAAEGAEGADLVVELAALARRHGTDNAAAAQAARALAALFAEPAACRVAAAPGVAHADRLSQALLGAAVCEDQVPCHPLSMCVNVLAPSDPTPRTHIGYEMMRCYCPTKLLIALRCPVHASPASNCAHLQVPSRTSAVGPDCICNCCLM